MLTVSQKSLTLHHRLTMTPALSFVIPLYYSAETLTALAKEIEGLTIEGGHELILVNDGSRDATAGICRE